MGDSGKFWEILGSSGIGLGGSGFNYACEGLREGLREGLTVASTPTPLASTTRK